MTPNENNTKQTKKQNKRVNKRREHSDWEGDRKNETQIYTRGGNK